MGSEAAGGGQVAARVQLLHTLARAFQSPAAGLREAVCDRAFLAALDEAVRAHPASRRLAGRLQAVEKALAPREHAGGPALEHEYSHLFLRKAKVPLGESGYGVDLTFGKPREMADIGAFHEAFGFRVSEAAGVPPDHLSVQLEFLALLCAKRAYAAAQGWHERAEVTRRAAARYLTEHLTGWLPVFRKRLEEHARLPFFPAVAALVEEAVSWEHGAAGGGEPRRYDTLLPSPGAVPGPAPPPRERRRARAEGSSAPVPPPDAEREQSSSFPCGGCPAAEIWS